ncbi:MAG: ABC transporter ATP-binding protein [Lachnospirales bacterium]
MENIVKSFGDVKAVKNGQFDLKKGEIHSLIGENGAGKSTMMKLLFGMYPFDNGILEIKGEAIKEINPKKAIDLGIGMVHQEFMLVDDLTVIENIFLGYEPKKGIVFDFGKARKIVDKYITQYNMNIQVNKKIRQISVGEAQRVEIIKILVRGADVIILDEPTAVLTPQEAKQLFKILKSLKEDGKSIVFISHKLDEVMEISDRISVMRQGEYIGTVNKEDVDQGKLAKMMIGRDIFKKKHKKTSETKSTILEVSNLWTSGEKEMSKIRGLNLSVKGGEIVGIAGIDGNGQSELIEAIVGMRKVEKGSINFLGEDVTNFSVKKIRERGLKHIPEDRNIYGLNKEMSIAENLISVIHDSNKISKRWFIDKQKVNKLAEQLIKDFDIRPPKASMLAGNLSGGNAQKIIVAREVYMEGNLLIASQPTRGVDIGAIESIHTIIEKVKDEGAGVLLISADLEEILTLSDRILVINQGEIVGEVINEDVDEEELGILMLGKGGAI